MNGPKADESDTRYTHREPLFYPHCSGHRSINNMARGNFHVDWERQLTHSGYNIFWPKCDDLVLTEVGFDNNSLCSRVT